GLPRPLGCLSFAGRYCKRTFCNDCKSPRRPIRFPPPPDGQALCQADLTCFRESLLLPPVTPATGPRPFPSSATTALGNSYSNLQFVEFWGQRMNRSHDFPNSFVEPRRQCGV